jgi:hypothetical protein
LKHKSVLSCVFRHDEWFIVDGWYNVLYGHQRNKDAPAHIAGWARGGLTFVWLLMTSLLRHLRMCLRCLLLESTSFGARPQEHRIDDPTAAPKKPVQTAFRRIKSTK